MLRLLILFALPCLCRGRGDQTLQAGTKGRTVVHATLERVQHSCIFKDDKLFFRRLAFIESHDGQSSKTYRSGYHGGIWQIDNNIYVSTKRSNSYLRRQQLAIRKYFNINWGRTSWLDLRKPLYSLLAARLSVGYRANSMTNGIPRSITAQASFWRRYYRQGGNVNVFRTKAKQLDTGCKASPGVDLCFVLDGSGSVGASNFQLFLKFVVAVVRAFSSTINTGATKVSVIQFSSSPVVEFDFRSYRHTSHIIRRVQRIRYQRGGTYTSLALDQMTQRVFNTARGARSKNSGHPRVGIVLTDGRSNSVAQTQRAARRAHAKDITVFSVGVGRNVNKQEMKSMASAPVCLHMFQLNNGFAEIDSLKTAIIKRSCNVPIPPFVPSNGKKVIKVKPGVEIKCKVKIPREGATVKIAPSAGSVTYYVAEKAYPNSAFYKYKVVGTANKLGVIYIRNTRTINSDHLVFCSIVAHKVVSTVKIDIKNKNRDWCRRRPCRNNGKCFDLGPSGYRCHCRPGFTGKTCATAVNRCVRRPSPCQHNGTCIPHRSSFRCRCRPGYLGSRCQIVNQCARRPSFCKHNGTCFRHGSFFKCRCQHGYLGSRCQIVNQCARRPSFCKHNGTCFRHGSFFKCRCRPGFLGSRCHIVEKPGFNCSTKSPCTARNRKRRIYHFPHTNPHKFVQCGHYWGCWVMPCPGRLTFNAKARVCT